MDESFLLMFVRQVEALPVNGDELSREGKTESSGIDIEALDLTGFDTPPDLLNGLSLRGKRPRAGASVRLFPSRLVGCP